MDSEHSITDKLSERLSKVHYHIRDGAELGAQPVRFVASKTKSIHLLAALSTHIVVLEKDGAKPSDIDRLFEVGFRLAKKINRIPLLRGMQFGYAVMPIIIGEKHDSETLLYATSPPTMPRFCVHKFPIVVEISGRRTVFFEGFVVRGGGIWPILQKIVTSYIEPLVDELAEPTPKATRPMAKDQDQ